jgi:hypothetical protein
VYSTPYGVTPQATDSDNADYGLGSRESLKEQYLEILGLDEPEDYEPTERDYKYLDA